MNVEKLIDIVASFRPDGVSENLTPCLIAPTGHGKTSLAASIAKRHGFPLISVLLHTGLPEDNTGLPRIVRKKIKGKFVHTTEKALPTWLIEAAQRPAVLLFDELDKASDDVLAGILTLLAERRLDGVELHPDTRVICAMQELDPGIFLGSKTGEAISARLVYFPLDPGAPWEMLENKFSVNLGFIPRFKVAVPPLLPQPAPRQVSWALQFISLNLNKLEEEELRVILSGLFHPPIVDALLHESRNKHPLTEDDLVAYYLEDPKRVIEGPVADAIQLMPHFLLAGNPAVFGAAMYRVTVMASVDEYEAMIDYVVDWFNQHTESGQEFPVPDENVARMADCFNWVAYQFALLINKESYRYHKEVEKPEEMNFLPDVPAGFQL